jgi:integrase/recombinase XerD
MATTSPLRQRMIEDMTIRNLSRATQQSYIYAVAKFSRHFNLSPDRLGMEEIRAYQLHLVAERHSWGHINQITCALRFFYGITLGQKEAIERIAFGREPEKLPRGGKASRMRQLSRRRSIRQPGTRCCGRSLLTGSL